MCTPLNFQTLRSLRFHFKLDLGNVCMLFFDNRLNIMSNSVRKKQKVTHFVDVVFTPSSSARHRPYYFSKGICAHNMVIPIKNPFPSLYESFCV